MIFFERPMLVDKIKPSNTHSFGLNILVESIRNAF